MVPRVLPLLEVAERMAGGEETANAGVPAEVDMGLDFSRWSEVPSFEFTFNSEKFSDRCCS
jgi:hypothetical protein